jgi:putative hemolysin
MEILYVVLLILLSGIFVMSEMAFVTSRKSKLKEQAEKGDARAAAAHALAEEPNTFLATAQIGITLLTILSGAVGENALRDRLGDVLENIPFVAIYSEQVSFVIVIGLITYISLVVGELIPKRLALAYPETVAKFLAGPMTVLSRTAGPIVTSLSRATDFVLDKTGIRPEYDQPLSEDELKVMIGEATSAGVLDKAEQEMFNKVFVLGDTKTKDLMTPFTELVWLDTTDKPETIYRAIHGSPHSHFPVYRRVREKVVGMVSVKDILEQVVNGNPLDLEEISQKPLYVIETMRIHNLLEEFRKNNTHIALVVDEYGALQGLISVNDVFEAIVGEIPDMEELEDEAKDPRFIRNGEDTWLVDGIVSSDEFKEHFKLDALWNEDEEDYQTLGGFVMNYLGEIPHEGSRFEWSGFSFEVVDMDGNRVDKVIVTRPRRVSSDDKQS